MRARMRIRIGIMAGLWVGLALVAARAGEVPEWAEQGNFRFIRVDGGLIETMKAERTWWGKEFSDDEKDVLTHIYDDHWDRMLGLLADAGFNWIWVTWSNGWSLEMEAQNREALARVIEQCHARGIKVTAYMSAANMFWKNTYRDDPETRKYGLRFLGVPVFYGGVNKTTLQVNWQRRIADLTDPGWRAYVLVKAELAVDAGVDGIFFDNIIGDADGMARLLAEVQAMAAERAAAAGRDKPLVHANVHIGPGRFWLHDGCDLVWEEAGKDSSGVWDGKWMVDNARKIKFLAGAKQPWQPLLYENDFYRCGQRERCIPGPAAQQVAMAEAHALGAAYSRNIEGRFLHDLVRGEPGALEAWAAIASYNRFFAERQDLYNRVSPAAAIALLSDSENNPAADAFIKARVIFETKALKRLPYGLPLSRFRVLVIPFKTGRLSDEQRRLLGDFTSSGGLIFCPEPGRLARDIGARDLSRFQGISRRALSALKSGEMEPEFRKHVEAAADGPTVSVTNGDYVAVNLTGKYYAKDIILHLINYNLETTARDVRVQLDLADLVSSNSGFEVTAWSPDERGSQIFNISQQNRETEFSIENLEHYAVVVIRPLH